MKRRLLYVSGSRADFGLMVSVLRRLLEEPTIDLEVFVTGAHLVAEHGLTVRDVEASGLPIAARFPVEMPATDGAGMAKAVGLMTVGLTEFLERRRPDAIILAGDRGEMLAGAIAAIHSGICIIHFHGGERSGTVDEPVRHAISKLAHYHFVTTAESQNRLLRMGEYENTIFVVGAPGLDGICDAAKYSRQFLCASAALDPLRPICLFVYHPVLELHSEAATEAENILRSVLEEGYQVVGVLPNSDAGGREARIRLLQTAPKGSVKLVEHLPRDVFVSWMSTADVMVGNSSSGILEAASFGIPVVNVGIRQNGRQRNANVFDCGGTTSELRGAICAARQHGRFPPENVYGDGQTGARAAALITKLSIPCGLLGKRNAY